MCKSKGMEWLPAHVQGWKAASVHSGVEWRDLPMLLMTGQLLMGFEWQKMLPWDTVET